VGLSDHAILFALVPHIQALKTKMDADPAAPMTEADKQHVREMKRLVKE
jgi:hypothetical protein